MYNNYKVQLKVHNMDKYFGPTRALNNVSIEVKEGEIRGLIGENGSGKSTLSSIIAGMQKASQGSMNYLGKSFQPTSMLDAQEQGISMVLQEMNTIPHISVAENIFAGQEEQFTKFGFVNRKEMIQKADSVLHEAGIHHINAKDSIDRYGMEDRKLVEIARAIKPYTKILIIDETTTALSQSGRILLYDLMKKMKNSGKSVIFISHDLDELLEVCNVLTVLRDGVIIGNLNKNEFEPCTIRQMMVGREIGTNLYRDDYPGSYINKVVMQLDNVCDGNLKDFSLELHKGEILGIGGLSGSGMHEVGRIAFGLNKLRNGRVVVNGNVINSNLNAIENNIGYISKNRDHEALILGASIKENLVLPSIEKLSALSYVSPKKEKILSQEQVKFLRIKCNSDKQLVSTLSGGNKQKVSFGKWIGKGSSILIMDCPTRGVDIGVKQAMYKLMMQLKNEGKSILMITEELSELIGMSDKILIMKDNRINGTFVRSAKLSEKDLIEYMI